MAISQIIILTGHRKSGTSVFHRLFDGHPEIYLYPVDISILYAYFPFFVEKMASDIPKIRERLKKVLSKSLLSCEVQINNAGFDIDSFCTAVINDLQPKNMVNKSEVIKAIAENWVRFYYKSEEDRPFIFKETSQSVYFNDFLSDHSKFKMINLIRDPRDNYAAIKSGVDKYYSQMDENEMESLASVINRARMDLFSGKVNADRYPENFMNIKFEDLVSDVEVNMREIANFIGIEFDDLLCNPTFFGNQYEGNSHENIKFKGIRSKNIGRWSERISTEEAKIIEYWLYDVMKYWGYKLEFDLEISQQAFADFYNWYNSRYFYRDSFK